jgi:hypothetical protein
MTITKLSGFFTMVILMAGVTVAAASIFVNVEAFADSDFKKKVSIKKCTNFNLNVNINGEEVVSEEFSRGDPICLNSNTNIASTIVD